MFDCFTLMYVRLFRLSGHKGLVTSVSFGYDGTHFASGGVDGGVLWEISGRGVVRYKLQSPIQCVKYNPVSHLILSCADGQLGLCMLHNKQVDTSYKLFVSENNQDIECMYCLIICRSPNIKCLENFCRLLGHRTEL